jgi:iron complex transport system substrate-binding protein
VKVPRSLFLLCLLSAALGAGAQSNAFPLHVTDDTGAAVMLAARPVRIVSLTLATDEMLLGMIDPARLQGVTAFAADPAVSNVADLAARVPHKLEMNVETVLTLNPDLVLVANWSDAAPVRQLRDAGVPVYQMSSGLTITSIEDKITQVARLTGDEDKGRLLTAGMEARLSAVARRVASIPQGTRVRVIDYGAWGSSQGRGSSWDEMLGRAGLVNGVSGLAADDWGQVSLSKEKLLLLDPDMVVLPGWVYGNPRGAAAFSSQFNADPSLQGLRAVKTGRVYQMPEKLKSTTSQYVAEAVEWLAHTAYPELF